jgi:hypothetical protein
MRNVVTVSAKPASRRATGNDDLIGAAPYRGSQATRIGQDDVRRLG